MADPDEDDWLASAVEYTTAEVLYGSPCGFAVPLGKTYWCEPIQRLISEQVRLLAKHLLQTLTPTPNLRSALRRRSIPSSHLIATRSTGSSRLKCLTTSAEPLFELIYSVF